MPLKINALKNITLSKLQFFMWLWVLGILLTGVSIYGQTQLSSAPGNLNFEAEMSGQPVSVWRLSPASAGGGYSFTVSDEKPYKGSFSGLLKRDENQTGQTPGIVVQAFDATNFRGKRIRFRAAVRTENGGNGQSQLWLRVDKQASGGNPPIGFFDNMQDRPIKSDKWDYYEIVGDVSSDAATINIGLLMLGGGKTWIDDASFEIIGNAEAIVAEPPRALSERGLINVTAFTRLMGYVRHFHPSDEAAKTDWESFTINGMRQIESAKHADELAQKLNLIFKPVAPTVAIYTGKKTPSLVAPPASAAKAMMWRHQGFGTGNPGVYKSERVEVALTDGKIPNDAPGPIIADLGGGVSAIIPSVVFADSSGTLPHAKTTILAKTDKAQPTKTQFTADDRATRLADVALAWNIFEHFYPYFDETKIDWMKVLPQTLKMAATDKDEREFEKTLKVLVSNLQDGHGNVIFGTPALYASPITWDTIDGKLVVTSVAKPIDGLHAGDVILSINGQPSERALQEKENLVSAATPQWKTYRGLQELARGQKDEPVELAIEPWQKLGQTNKVTVTRDTLFYTINEKRPDKISELEPGIFYLNLDQISSKDFNEILPKLEQAKGIIFDLRGYPKLEDPLGFFSHLSDKPLTSAKFLIPIITLPDHRNMQFQGGGDWQIKPTAPYLSAKKVFITDGRAISYAESVMGIVENYKLGEIVGAATAGTNGNINPFQLPGGYQIIFTGMKVQKHDGSQHHGIGILPTVKVTRTRAGIAAGRDEFLEKAVELLKR